MMKSLARHIIESDGMTKAAAPGDVASSIAAFFRKSPVMMPALGGLAGAGMMTPFAVKSFKEGRSLEGVGQLGTGAVLGAGAGLLGRTAMKGHSVIKQQEEIIKKLQEAEVKEPGTMKKILGLFHKPKVVDRVVDAAKAGPRPLTKIERLRQPKNVYTAGGAIVGAGLASAEAEQSFKEENKYKGITQLGLGALLGGLGGKMVSVPFQAQADMSRAVQESLPARVMRAVRG